MSQWQDARLSSTEPALLQGGSTAYSALVAGMHACMSLPACLCVHRRLCAWCPCIPCPGCNHDYRTAQKLHAHPSPHASRHVTPLLV